MVRSRASFFTVGVFFALVPLLMSCSENLPNSSLAWVVVPSPTTSGAATELVSVSCVSSSFCVAVGDAADPHNGSSAPVVESWNGVSWSMHTLPRSAMWAVSAVSCSSTSFCMATGTGPSTNYALSFDGKRWSVKNVSILQYTEDISCSSVAFCVAVGPDSSASWNGKRWRNDRAVPAHGSQRLFELSGVDCTSSSFCMAVGETHYNSNPYIASHDSVTFAETWNGRRWSIIPTPNIGLSKGYFDGFTSVSCTSERSCVAVGIFGEWLTFLDPLIVSWNGLRWTQLAAAAVWAPNTPHQGLWLSDEPTAVSCTKNHACTAVGEVLTPLLRNPEGFPARTLVESSAGARWRVVRSPNRSVNDLLKALSCITPTECIAVGSDGTDDSHYSTLIEASPAWPGGVS